VRPGGAPVPGDENPGGAPVPGDENPGGAPVPGDENPGRCNSSGFLGEIPRAKTLENNQF
jgi:hypothetical protein